MNMKTWPIVICTVLVVLLAACAYDAGEPTRVVPTGVSTAQAADASAGSEAADSGDIVVQYDVFGGLMAPGPGTRLPLWTLYSDGLLVWIEDGPPTPGFAAQVWTGHLSEDEVASLLAFADEVGFWDLASDYQPEPILSESTAEPGGVISIQPNPEAGLDQPTSILLAAMDDRRHQVTVYPANWQGAPEAYHALRQRLLEMRPADAALFVPTSFVLQAEVMSEDAIGGLRVAEWPFVDISLADAATAPLSLDSEQGIAAADFIAADGLFVSQGGNVYKVDLLADAPRTP
jgi:hypothetical protein